MERAKLLFRSLIPSSTGPCQVRSVCSIEEESYPLRFFFFFGMTEIQESMLIEYIGDGDIGDIGLSGAVVFCDTLSGAGEVGGRPAGALCREE